MVVRSRAETETDDRPACCLLSALYRARASLHGHRRTRSTSTERSPIRANRSPAIRKPANGGGLSLAWVALSVLAPGFSSLGLCSSRKQSRLVHAKKCRFAGLTASRGPFDRRVGSRWSTATTRHPKLLRIRCYGPDVGNAAERNRASCVQRIAERVRVLDRANAHVNVALRRPESDLDHVASQLAVARPSGRCAAPTARQDRTDGPSPRRAAWPRPRPAPASTERRDGFVGVLGDYSSVLSGVDVGSALAQRVADRAPPILRALGGVDGAGCIGQGVSGSGAIGPQPTRSRLQLIGPQRPAAASYELGLPAASARLSAALSRRG